MVLAQELLVDAPLAVVTDVRRAARDGMEEERSAAAE
jgi:hypothetical protein